MYRKAGKKCRKTKKAYIKNFKRSKISFSNINSSYKTKPGVRLPILVLYLGYTHSFIVNVSTTDNSFYWRSSEREYRFEFLSKT
jgi:hypothetical protein